MAGYINYRAGNTNYKIPFCETTPPTAPAIGYYCGGAYYLPLVNGLTTATGSGCTCIIGNYAYYAVKPDVTVRVGSGTMYAANARQYCGAGATSSLSKRGDFSNNYCSPSSCYYRVTTTCTCTKAPTICEHEGVSSINRFALSSGTVSCTYSGTLTNGALPTPTQVASATGIAICNSGIIGLRWKNCSTGCCAPYGATSATAFNCNCFSGYWTYSSLDNPTLYFRFSRTNCGNCWLNATMASSCYAGTDLYYTFCGTGICCAYYSWRREIATESHSNYLAPSSNNEITVKVRCISGCTYNTNCSLYILVCSHHGYNIRYFYTSGSSGCPNLGSFTDATYPTNKTITWACLYRDLYFNK